MKINELQSIAFEMQERIITSTLSGSNELVMLLSSGEVVRYQINEKESELLFSVKSSFSYMDGGFDLDAPSTIYTLDSIVVVVNDYKRHGFVHYPEKYHKLHLWREDYHADISCYPVALFKNEQGIPHLIYSEAWNHLQIMNLDTRQILTASKSLIELNAEERHIEFYKKHTEDNKLAWPRPYDYFFAKLEMSPNNQYFLSKGWAWGSCDAYNVYEVKHFIENNRIVDIPIAGWEHSNRAACWIDNETVAVAYNPLEEGDDDATKDSPQEIHFYQIKESTAEVKRKVQVEGLNIVNSEIHFLRELNAILILLNNQGIAIISLEGKRLLRDAGLTSTTYCPTLNQLVKTDDESVTIYTIENEINAETT